MRRHTLRRLSLCLAAAACASLAGSAAAQNWPQNGVSYKCRWSLQSNPNDPNSPTSYGESIVTFLNLVDSGPETKTGQLRTYYPKTNFTSTKDVTLYWNEVFYHENLFDLVVSGGPSCRLRLYSGTPAGGGALRFDGSSLFTHGLCSNGAFQVCARWNSVVL